MAFVDSHVHLNFIEFDGVRNELLARCRAKGVTKMIIPSVNPEDWGVLQELCASEQGLYYTAGLHPCFLGENSLSIARSLSDFFAERPASCVGVGEIGLDARAPAMDLQLEVFKLQLRFAKEYDYPVVIHSVRSHAQILRCVKELGGVRGVLHAFSGSRELAEQFVGLGLKVGVGGVVCRESAVKTRNAISGLPLESLIIETDAPGMFLPGAKRGAGTPLDLLSVFEVLAAFRAESAEEIERHLWLNSHTLFGLSEA